MARLGVSLLVLVLAGPFAPSPADATTISHGHAVVLEERGLYAEIKRRSLRNTRTGGRRTSVSSSKFGRHGGASAAEKDAGEAPPTSRGGEVLGGCGDNREKPGSKWKPEDDQRCIQEMNSGGVSIGGGVVRKSAPFSDRWGNALTPYWMGRMVAFLGGYRFQGGMSGDWMNNLPKDVPADDTCPSKKLFQELCNANYVYGPNRPRGYFYTYGHSYSFHGFPNAIRAFQPTLARDTRAAMETHARNTGRKIPVFQPDDVVIADRCHGGDSLLGHRVYGAMAHSFYSPIPRPKAVRKISIVHSPHHMSEICVAKRDSLIKYLKGRNPGAEVVTQSSPDRWVDFAMLVYAPTLFVDHGSWGLWGGLANTGVVHAPRFFNARKAVDPHDKYFKTYPLRSHGPFSEKWKFSRAPVLSNLVSKEELKVEPDVGNHVKPEVIAKVVHWVETH